MMAAILNSAIILDSAILHTHTCQKFPTQKTSIILTQLDDCSHLDILPSFNSAILHKKTSLIHSDSTWMVAAILNCCHHGFSHFAQKKLHSFILHSTWWWQPSWILPCWIQTLPSWIQTPCYLLSDSLKNTLPPLWPWLKLIQSDLQTCILPWILPSSIQPYTKLWLQLIQSHSNSFILNLKMAAILYCAILNSAIGLPFC